jgi:hypothetical protein
MNKIKTGECLKKKGKKEREKKKEKKKKLNLIYWFFVFGPSSKLKRESW